MTLVNTIREEHYLRKQLAPNSDSLLSQDDPILVIASWASIHMTGDKVVFHLKLPQWWIFQKNMQVPFFFNIDTMTWPGRVDFPVPWLEDWTTSISTSGMIPLGCNHISSSPYLHLLLVRAFSTISHIFAYV